MTPSAGSAERLRDSGEPRTFWTFLRACLDGLLLTCPRCHKGRMAARAFGYRMRKQCDRCWLVFEPDQGEMTGGMGINMVLTSLLGTAFAICAAFVLHANVFVAAAALIVGGLAFGLWFHPHARGLWVAVLYASGQLLPPTGHAAGAPSSRVRRGAAIRTTGASPAAAPPADKTAAG